MKKINTFFNCLFLSLFLVNLSAQDLFTSYIPTQSMWDNIVLTSQDSDLTREKIIFLDLNQSFLDDILNIHQEEAYVRFPFFNGQSLTVKLKYFHVFSESIEVSRITSKGTLNEKYTPGLKTYSIESEDYNIKGVLIFSDTGVKAVIRFNDNIYQIDQFRTSDTINNTVYMMFNIDDSVKDLDFVCKNEDLDQLLEIQTPDSHRTGSVFGCVEIVIEIDYFTLQSIGSYQQSLDWALEMIAVVNELFLEEINIGLKSNYARVWEIQDPYVDFVDEPQNMLTSLREYWINNDELQNIERHLVHLFSKRNNTGTGGIAFLNGIGNTWNGYGFSSDLTDVEDYIDLPVPYFFWNIYCLAHELGHNFGAKHTQWCGWPGGPIDNCANLEEMIAGECDAFINNPLPQQGTLMSYCHTWSFEYGGGIVMKFHDEVRSAIMAYAGLQNLDDCGSDVLGCLDADGCNYDELATVEDQSCLYPEVGVDCFGNCLTDFNQDGICDDFNTDLNYNTDVSFNIYPNPASKFISVRADNLVGHKASLQVYNSIGQLVFLKNNFNCNQEYILDVSYLAQGNYTANLITNNLSIKKNLIIQ
jgi:hypothetical protein